MKLSLAEKLKHSRFHDFQITRNVIHGHPLAINVSKLACVVAVAWQGRTPTSLGHFSGYSQLQTTAKDDTETSKYIINTFTNPRNLKHFIYFYFFIYHLLMIVSALHIDLDDSIKIEFWTVFEPCTRHYNYYYL